MRVLLGWLLNRDEPTRLDALKAIIEAEPRIPAPVPVRPPKRLARRARGLLVAIRRG